jgi:hypothetical protein
MSGTGKAGDIVTLYDGGKAIGSVTVGADGKWTIKPTADLSDGSHDVYAIEKNPAGAQSQASTHTAFTVDTHPVTTTPVITSVIDAVGPVQGNVPTGGTTDDTMPTIKGTGKAGELIYLYDNGRGCGGVYVDANGNWSIQIKSNSPLTNAEHHFTADAQNSAGVWSLRSNDWTITVDAGTPDAPVISSVMDNVGTITGAIKIGGVTDDTRPVVSGTGKAGDIVRLFDGSTMIGSVKVGSDGKWTIQPANALLNAVHDLYATDTNAAGTTSLASAHFGFTVNTTTPATPAVPVITDNGSLIPPGGTMYDGHPVITGSGTSGDTIKVYDNGNVIGSTTIGGDGKWSFTPSTDLSNGSHDLYVIETNAAGTASAPSTHISFSVAPGPSETVTISNLIDDAGGRHVSIPNGGSTIDTTPTVQGTISSSLLAGETVVVYRDGVKVGTATVNGTSWSFGDSNVSVASHTYTARVETASIQGKFSDPFSFTESPWTGAVGMGFSLTNLGPGLVDAVIAIDPSLALIEVWVSGSRGNINSDRFWRMYPDLDNMRSPQIAFLQGRNVWKITFSAFQSSLPADSVLTMFGYDANYNRIELGKFTAGWAYAHATVDQPTGVYTLYDFPSTVQSVLKGQSAIETSIDDQSHASSIDASQPEQHTVVGEHDGFKGNVGGNETVDLKADPASYFKEATAHIEGAKGGAVDTLHLTGDHQILDLTSLTGKTAAAKISGIEVIDLGGQHNTLKLSLVDVLNLGETDLFQQDGKQQLMVNGKEGDVVDLSNSHVAGLAEGEWQQHGTTQVGGVTYNVYEHSGAHTELLVQQGVQIAVH